MSRLDVDDCVLVFVSVGVCVFRIGIRIILSGDSIPDSMSLITEFVFFYRMERFHSLSMFSFGVAKSGIALFMLFLLL